MNSLFSVCCFDEKATFFSQFVSLNNRLKKNIVGSKSSKNIKTGRKKKTSVT